MRILFDQATPVPLRAFLKGHLVRTAAQQGWAHLENGRLLKAAEDAGFDLLLTTDRNMRYQQQIAERHIAVMVLDCQQWPRLKAHTDLVVEALTNIRAGSFLEISIPDTRNE